MNTSNEYANRFSIAYWNRMKNFYKEIFEKADRRTGELATKSQRRRFIKRTLLYLPQSLNMANYIINHRYLSTEVLRYPMLTSKMHRPYLCNVFGVNKRLSSIKESYDFIDTYFPSKISEKLYRDGEFELVELCGINEEIFKVYFQLYSEFDKEGEFILKVLNSQNIPLARVTFSITKEGNVDTIFIGGIQGPAKGVEKDLIKEATKSLAGVFPKKVLVEAIYALENSLNKKLDKICVGNRTHVFEKKRVSKKKKITASYDEFLETLNATELDNGLWKLPLELGRKDIADIPSKKRSEYRKRYTILDKISSSIFEKFNESEI